MDISLIEFIVYGIVGYGSIVMLIISTQKETPVTKSQSLLHSIYMIPGIICLILLAGSGVNIYLNDSVTTTNATSIYEVLDNTNAIVVLNSTVTETVAESNKFILQNPIWVILHYMFALILFAFVFTKLLMLLLFN